MTLYSPGRLSWVFHSNPPLVFEILCPHYVFPMCSPRSQQKSQISLSIIFICCIYSISIYHLILRSLSECNSSHLNVFSQLFPQPPSFSISTSSTKMISHSISCCTSGSFPKFSTSVSYYLH